jgi:hypothetical protein
MGETDKNTLRCSFCDKSQYEVHTLISAPAAYICDECVSACADIVKSRKQGTPILTPLEYKTATPAELTLEIRLLVQMAAKVVGRLPSNEASAVVWSLFPTLNEDAVGMLTRVTRDVPANEQAERLDKLVTISLDRLAPPPA